MNNSIAAIVAMLVQACQPVGQLPEVSEVPPLHVENPAIVEVMPQAVLPGALTCLLEQTETSMGFRVVARLVAPETGAKGHYVFSFDRKGGSSISISRTSDFNLKSGENMVLSETAMETSGQIEAVLKVDGKSVPCGDA